VVTPQLPEPDLHRYSREQVDFAASAWPLRAAEELRSARIFHALTHAARAAGLPERWTDRFASATRDEVRHTKLCADIARRLGAGQPHYDDAPVRMRLAALPDPIARAATLLLVEVAVGESVSTSQFATSRRGAREPLTHAALTAILRDEVRHARLGWTGIAALLPALSESRRDALGLEVTRAFGAMERQIAAPALAWLEAEKPFDPAWEALGVIEPSARVAAFYEAIEGLVLPRLARLGFDSKRAWSRRYRD